MIQRSQTTRALLGLAIVVVVGVVGYFGTRLAQGAFAEDYRFSVVIGETGQGLVSGSDVAARGVLIGRVGEISLTDDLRAQVELILEPQYQVPTDANFGIVGKTLFGEKQLEVVFNGDPTQAAAFIPNDGMVDSPDQVVEVQDVLEALDDLLGAIDPEDLAIVVDDGLGAFVGQEDNISRAIDQGARATDVLARSLDDQTPSLRDISLVAEALGPVGDDFNRLAATIDGGALDTLTANQGRLRILFAELTRFADQLDLVLRLTRADLDRLMIQGDSVTRMLFTYRPELADLVEGLDEYSDTIGNGGQTDPGWSGFAAGFQIILEENPAQQFCEGVPPEFAEQFPGCSAEAAALASANAALGQPTTPVPLLTVPNLIDPSPEGPATGGIEDIFSQVLGDLDYLRGNDQ